MTWLDFNALCQPGSHRNIHHIHVFRTGIAAPLLQQIILPRHPSISRTLPLPKPSMSTNPPRCCQLPSTGARVHCDLLADDEAIRNKFADRLTGVGIRNLVDFVGVEPDLAFPAADHGCRKTLLST